MNGMAEILQRHDALCERLLGAADAAAFAEDWHGWVPRFAGFRDALRHRIDAETRVVLPGLAPPALPSEAAATLTADCAALRALLGEAATCGEAGDGTGYAHASESLHALLKRHRSRSTAQLYPACAKLDERAFAPQVARAIGAQGEDAEGAFRVVDVRWLEPPEPMERIIEALTAAGAGERIQMLIHREPFPLYDLLQQNGYAWRTTARADGCFELLISRR